MMVCIYFSKKQIALHLKWDVTAVEELIHWFMTDFVWYPFSKWDSFLPATMKIGWIDSPCKDKGTQKFRTRATQRPTRGSDIGQFQIFYCDVYPWVLLDTKEYLSKITLVVFVICHCTCTHCFSKIIQAASICSVHNISDIWLLICTCLHTE